MLSAGFFIAVLALFNFISLPSAQAGAPSAALFAKRQYVPSEIIKTKEFYLITFTLVFGAAAFFILNPSFKTLAAERGIDASVATLIVMLTGVASSLGRLGVPLLSDKIGREQAALVSGLATAVCALLLVFAQGPLFMTAIAVIAFCYGGGSGIFPVLIADYFGIKNVGSNFGAVMIGFAISALTFPIIFTTITDVTIKFITLGSISAIGVLLLVLLMKFGKKE
jgi:OFA family oxalate/formate antiporter-like MFS transporter